jgi:hypothetical protein
LSILASTPEGALLLDMAQGCGQSIPTVPKSYPADNGCLPARPVR